MNDKVLRSPFFYVGDKYKLVPQLQKFFPKHIDTYVEPFVGGGSVFLNTKARRYILNDIDQYVIELHLLLSSYAGRSDKLLSKLFKTIDRYGLSCSFRNKTVPKDLKVLYPKTYYSHYNKDSYNQLKADYNSNHDLHLLYILSIYGFNHMIRFNSSGVFNLPVGNVDFNKNVYHALCNYLNFIVEKEIKFYNLDFEEFLDTIDKNSFVYLDPPYLISGSEYNKFWSNDEEIRLCNCLDDLNRAGTIFGVTNLVRHKGQINELFLNWSKKYTGHDICSNYISFNDNTIKTDSREVLVTNYGEQ